jgi:hypothetical protein
LPSNGRLALVGSSLLVTGRQQVEAGHAERMDHAVRSAGQHHVGIAPADHFDRLADRLAAGGTGGQAIEVRALGVEHGGQVRRGHVRFLLQFLGRVEQRFKPFGDELGGVVFAATSSQRSSSW